MRKAASQSVPSKDAYLIQLSLMFQNKLTCLRYEGKPRLGANIEAMTQVLQKMEFELLPFMRFEEEEIFPFVVRHVPKYETAVRVLEAEHSELKSRLNTFQTLFQSFKITSNILERNYDSLFDTGSYLVYLLRHHAQTKKHLYRLIKNQLRPEEKKQLTRLSNASSVSIMSAS